MKTKIFNLIILDESGSMQHLANATVGGCNETLNTIISSQHEFAETQENFVSVYVFQSETSIPSRYIFFNMPATEGLHITPAQYRPFGATPLYDAIGETVGTLEKLVKEHKDAIGSVTVITDGYENSSHKFTRNDIAALIERLKGKGWNFNFIGANIDAAQVASSLNINNSMQFEASPEGTDSMWDRFAQSRQQYGQRLNNILASEDDDDDSSFEARCSQAADNFFRES